MAQKINYDLEERTTVFSENIIKLCLQLKISVFSENIIKQLLKSGTSIGANYMEANGACSKKDFKNKIRISLKEARETKYWLRLLILIYKDKSEEINTLRSEAQELTLIFGKIVSSLKN